MGGAGVTKTSLQRIPNVSRFWEKMNLTASYKFVCAFENSNSTDYASEKLFMGFAAGTIPVHMGFPQVHKFGPSPKSIISVHDFESPAALAKYLKYLDGNKTAYMEYVDWKEKGVSTQFRALVDLSNVHSFCRLCIRIGDLYRWRFGESFEAGNPWDENNKQVANSDPKYLKLKIRERGKFWLRDIYLVALTVEELEDRVYENFERSSNDAIIYDIYTIKDRNVKIKTDEDLKQLQYGTEIEFYYVKQNPNYDTHYP